MIKTGATRTIYLMTAVIFSILFAGIVTAAEPAGRLDYKPGEILVKLHKGISIHQLQHTRGLANLDVKQHFPHLSRVKGQDYLLLKARDLSEGGEFALLRLIKAIPGVAEATLNHTRRLMDIPNDPLFPRQWGLHNTGQFAHYSTGSPGVDIGAPAAWDINTGSPDVVIAVMDTGVDYMHEDLSVNMWRNPGEIPGNGIDDDGNNYIDDVYGYDFAADLSGNNDGDPMDIDGHGTHVSGIIAAAGNNAIGIAGICWNAKIMAVKTFRPTSPDPYIYTSDELEAFEYIVMMKTQYNVNVVAVNCSFGGGAFNQLEQDAIEAAGDAGIVVCAAAGNGGDDDVGDDNNTTPIYPASHTLSNIISVAATDNNDELADFSNYGGSSVDIAAPGSEIMSTILTGQGDGSAYVEAAGVVHHAVEMTFSGQTAPISHTLHHCGRGLSAGDFPAAVNGNIALIERGDISFAEKVTRAMNAGARAAIIYNNDTGLFLGTLGEAGNWIPAFSMSREDGLLLLGMGTPVITLENRPSNYGYKQGTSMAAPHVCGAVGLSASRFPQENAVQRVTRILLSAQPVASLANRVRTGGRLDIGSIKIQAPLNLQARRIANRSFLLTEYINLLTWQSNSQNQSNNITGYNIYLLNGKTIELLGHVPAGQTEYQHRQAGSSAQYTYAVTAVDAEGTRGEPSLVNLNGN